LFETPGPDARALHGQIRDPMIFKRLLGRKKPPAPPGDDQDALIRTAREAQDAGARCEACRRIRSLQTLRDLAATDPDASVRVIASARYRTLLCAGEEGAPALAERLTEVAALDDEEILGQVAREGREAELRRAAILEIRKPEVLASCAVSDATAANRSAAVELLDDKESLARVVKDIGKKDTRVYRTARRRLREIAEREALPERIRAQCEDLCEKLERLGRFGKWVQDRAFLDLLDRQWAEIEEETDPELRVRYSDLRERFLHAYEEYRSEHEAQIAAEEAREAVRAEREALIVELQSVSALDDELPAGEAMERISARWDELASPQDKERGELDREYEAAMGTASGHLSELREVARRSFRLQELVGQAEKILGSAKSLDQKQIRGLIDEARQHLDAKGVDRSLAGRLSEVRERLDERLLKQKTQAEKGLERLPGKLDDFAEALDKGLLKEAESLYQSITAGIELIEHSGLPPKAYAEAVARLRALVPGFRDLQKWRKWGADQHREGLCVAMEALASEDLRLEAIALRLHDLQMEWKGLDKGGSPVNHPMWDRFHAASERVYARCKPYLDEQAAQLEINRREREALCAGLEDFLDQADWERMDWKKAARADREMRQAWSEMGPVEGRYRKGLEKRFRSALKRLDGYLAEERERNLAHKRELIARVEALAEEPDLGRAIEEAKRLQRQWQTSVAARQKEEHRLWQRFRAGCDVLFNRRREQQEAQDAELAENLHRREDLCLEAEKLADSDSDAGPDELSTALRELDSRWRDLDALPVPRRSASALVQRWRAARRRAEHRRRELLEEQRSRDLDLLAEQAALCERLERALEVVDADLDPALTALEADWLALPTHRDPDLQAAMAKRFGRALEALKQGGEKLQALRSAFVADGERRAELCLHLEILAQVESPPELAEERLRFQVTRLTEHMSEGEKDPLEASYRLLQQWYLCCPAPASVAGDLEKRFLRARRAVEVTVTDSDAAGKEDWSGMRKVVDG
jgi:DNA repair protein SbcC/Rad50